MAYISPTSTNTPSGWTDPSYAIDGDVEIYAVDGSVPNETGVYGNPLTFNLGGTYNINSIQYWGEQNNESAQGDLYIKIDVYNTSNSTWENVYQGQKLTNPSIPQTVDFTTKPSDKYRISHALELGDPYGDGVIMWETKYQKASSAVPAILRLRNDI